MSAGERAAPAVATCTAVGLCLLPSELVEEIFCRLALPEILRIRSVSRSLGSVVAGDAFQQLYGLRSGTGGGWIFILKKRPPREAVLRGFNDRAGRWFQFPIAGILPPAEDLYFLAASGDFFLFASNSRRELIVVDLPARTFRRLPLSPLGPRGTSSWRRSGLKLVADPSGSSNFRFMFTELCNNEPYLFEYNSETNTWQSSQAVARNQLNNPEGSVVLHVTQFGSQSVVLCADRSDDQPAVVRPRFAAEIGPITSERWHVYGDGYAAAIWSVQIDDEGRNSRLKIVTNIKLFGMSSNAREWELISSVPEELIKKVSKAYGVTMGCLHERSGVIRLILMSNCKGCWDLMWLAYDKVCRSWAAVPVPDSGTKGLNMAGIAISSSFSKLRPSLLTKSSSSSPPSSSSPSSQGTFLSSL